MVFWFSLAGCFVVPVCLFICSVFGVLLLLSCLLFAILSVCVSDFLHVPFCFFFWVLFFYSMVGCFLCQMIVCLIVRFACLIVCSLFVCWFFGLFDRLPA